MTKITIIKGKKVDLKRPEFNCDHILRKDVPEPYNHLVNGFKSVCLIGRPASGKTSMLFSLFKDKRILKKCFNNIILIMPRESLNSMSKKSNIFRDLADEKFYEDISSIDEVRDQVKGYASEKETSCIIIDDMASKLKNPEVIKVLSDIIMNRRHYKTSIFILSQIYMSVPLVLRKLINNIMIMYKPSIKEIQQLMEETLEQKPEVANEIIKIAFKKPYDFLFIDIPSQEIYASYDRIIIEDS